MSSMFTPPSASTTDPASSLGVSVFDGLDWDVPPVPARMLVELPFRLLSEDVTYNVTVEGCTVQIQVLGQLVETNGGGRAVTIHDAVVGDSSASWATIQRSGVAVQVRAMRTTLAFTVTATPGTLRGLHTICGETINAHRFARALLDGHIEHINHLVNVYRVTASDPYPFEVSVWDIHGCYIQLDGAWYAPISLIPYLESNENPVFTKAGMVAPILLAGSDDIRTALAEPLPAGEVDLQDGWAQLVRGHFAAAITSFVTAIEVTLEAAIDRTLTLQGASSSEREERLAKTFNNFDARFSDYLRIVGRAAPGPIVSMIPYIHGLRLREEFGLTRGLRHKVVHEGRRISSTLRGPALRAAETTTWLFDWMNERNRVKARPGHGLRIPVHLSARSAWT